MPRLQTCSFILGLLFLLSGTAWADEITEIKEALAAKGLKPSQTTLVVEDEPSFAKSLTDLNTPQRNLLQATKQVKQLEDQAGEGKKQITALKQEQVRLNAQLAGAQDDVLLNNRIVGALRAMDGQMDLITSQLEQHDGKVREARNKANEAREKYIELLLSLRKSAEKITAAYEAKAADREVQAVMERMKGVTGKSYTLGPSQQFVLALKKLKSFEDLILSESIVLRAEGRTLYVSVVVNGKHTHEMVLDSGANLISLPLETAKKFGITPSSKDQEIRVILADGSEIPAWKMTIPSVRVGKFTVENVECAVLGPEAIKAEPLLGMSFLGKFQFEVDSSTRKLTMVKVADGK